MNLLLHVYGTKKKGKGTGSRREISEGIASHYYQAASTVPVGQIALFQLEKDAILTEKGLLPAGTQSDQENQSARYKDCKGDKQY